MRLARPCGPEQLVVTHAGGAGGFTSSYYARFTVFNLSERACSTSGFPKLFALRTGGRPVEGPAAHGTAAPEASDGPMNIAGRGVAAFLVSWSADVYPRGGCGPRIVTAYRVVLPGSNLSQTIPYPNFDHCTGAAARGSLAVGRIEPSPEPARPVPAPPRLEEAKPSERLPRCDPADLVVWQGMNYPGGAAAGTSYGHLAVTNLSERPCKLSGVPRAVAVDLRGRAVGPPVGRSASMPTIDGEPPIRVARLEAHGSALFTFSVAEVLDYGTHGCDYEYAAGFDVTLPGSSRSQYVPAPVRRCLRSVAPNGPQVSVGPIE
ncbi:MAG TPA: DUF4232 domain-containing protein [Solirubrobacterales bacterium]|nr:DUF4232 domain-containing protein [Solirubrobacterales bacterium]